MSTDNVKKFSALCAKDSKLMAEVKKAGLDKPEAVIAIAKGKGLDFTKEELKAVAKEGGLFKDELSDKDLDKVAGGTGQDHHEALAGAASRQSLVGGAGHDSTG